MRPVCWAERTVAITIANGVGYQDFEPILNYQTVEEFDTRIAESTSVLKMIYPIDKIYVFNCLAMVFGMVLATGNLNPIGVLSCVAALGAAVFFKR